MKGVFVTGTDTGVGKTLSSALLFSALRANGIPAGYFKAVQTGDDDDTRTIERLTGASGLPRPAYSFSLPAAPSRAARAEGRRVELATIRERFLALPEKFWIVEGAGGLLVPLNEREVIRDLVRELELPLVIVASTRLGTINHTLLTLESARRAGLEVLGLVLTGKSDPGLEETLAERDPARVLARIPELAQVTPGQVQALGPELFAGVFA